MSLWAQDKLPQKGRWQHDERVDFHQFPHLAFQPLQYYLHIFQLDNNLVRTFLVKFKLGAHSMQSGFYQIVPDE